MNIVGSQKPVKQIGEWRLLYHWCFVAATLAGMRVWRVIRVDGRLSNRGISMPRLANYVEGRTYSERRFFARNLSTSKTGIFADVEIVILQSLLERGKGVSRFGTYFGEGKCSVVADEGAAVFCQQVCKGVDRFGGGDVAEGFGGVAPYPLGFIFQSIDQVGHGSGSREADIAENIGGSGAERPPFGAQCMEKVGYGCCSVRTQPEARKKLAGICMLCCEVVIE